jgi:hypothetical protein
MENDSQKESKSIGRNIFAENQGEFFRDKGAQKSKETSAPKKDQAPKSFGRNIFSELPQTQTTK